MRALKKTRKLIEHNPEKPEAKILSALVVALESEEPFKLSELYQLDYNDFGLALELLSEWRLDRYYTSKAVLLDISMQLGQLLEDQAAPPAVDTAEKN
ncbi:MAG: hypothetical protein U1D25_04390 [Hydrogenophaga sp.]|uniref:hypothetical protein n=1 Tax=Hydrogenophaga sp. TaxID=1904254 RepID=UPI0027642897|nr:hypothetical protein [Hydrogenophaga sp.]MDP2417901.1 hypothetical protein [Hydrogenophaga sp.]MDZ4187339.1 hypothetical protein [Hydrogenophaga sp.]